MDEGGKDIEIDSIAQGEADQHLVENPAITSNEKAQLEKLAGSMVKTTPGSPEPIATRAMFGAIREGVKAVPVAGPKK